MSTFRKRRLGQAAAGVGYSTLYTCPSGKQAEVRVVDFANTTGATIGAYLHLVPSGGVADTTNALIFNVDIVTKGVLTYTGGQVLEAGDTLQIKGSATGLAVTASGVEISGQGR
jgi:hypothetical protein